MYVWERNREIFHTDITILTNPNIDKRKSVLLAKHVWKNLSWNFWWFLILLLWKCWHYLLVTLQLRLAFWFIHIKILAIKWYRSLLLCGSGGTSSFIILSSFCCIISPGLWLLLFPIKKRKHRIFHFSVSRDFMNFWKLHWTHTHTYADMQYHWYISSDINLIHFHIESMVMSLNFVTPSI